MIKALVFDCFGVLAEDGWGLIDARFEPTEEQWREMSDISHKTDLGQLSLAELVENFARTLEVEPDEIRGVIARQKKNYELLEFVGDLKPRYKIAMLSNVGRGFIQEFFTEQEQKLFDVLVLSSERGIAKPDPRIFRLTAQELELDVEECLFIDDHERNVAAAQDVDMPAIVYTNFETLKADLADANVELTG